MDKKQILWLLLKQIPKGKVTAYKILAEELGTHPRAIGKMLNSNPHPVIVPCHRVVRSDGGIGGYALGVKKKIALLKEEGIVVERGYVDLDKCLFKFARLGFALKVAEFHDFKCRLRTLGARNIITTQAFQNSKHQKIHILLILI